ncbi:neutral/alkaline non-lysosomal ceramidase N-terminal domain-containing protein [Pleomorphovibrio marinus]|uniref:neutral/alkaline non-lysosomal ceramidase N-terminal domain-containing protein n=1 Tax=Pleomorphovibrio marinus TaxID=2164132 RepID=UPI000E0A5713|nr:neutral/alkaline non-lysosomal ceramidase N-terminal domain-containing protein [Pleomorphovibrio marinus]
MKNIPYSLLLALFLYFPLLAGSTSFPWKAGVAQEVITPESNLWMAGYAARTKPAEGKQHELWIKAVSLEDAQGNEGVWITSDILGFPKALSDRIKDQLYHKYGISRAQVILSSSHTHSGPVLEQALFDIYPLDDAQIQAIKDYTSLLEKKVIALVEKARQNRMPARISTGQGVSRFQVNRRNNPEMGWQEKPHLDGPMDHAVPVIKIENEKGVQTVIFGYACHPTVLDQYEWSGDYPGYAQLALEQEYPSTAFLFFQGASGDQNPIPRRTVPLAKQYGKTLAAAVSRVLEEEMEEQPSLLRVAYEEFPLPFAEPFSVSELQGMAKKERGYLKRWAERMLKESQEGIEHPDSYPYPIQLWTLGEQALFSLGGEVTVSYALALKAKYGWDTFVMAYSNDVMGYIPSETILEEGGYEGYQSQMVYGLPTLWEKGIEKNILSKLDEMASELGLRPSK